MANVYRAQAYRELKEVTFFNKGTNLLGLFVATLLGGYVCRGLIRMEHLEMSYFFMDMYKDMSQVFFGEELDRGEMLAILNEELIEVTYGANQSLSPLEYAVRNKILEIRYYQV